SRLRTRLNSTEQHTDRSMTMTSTHDHSAHAAQPGGLQVSEHGYTLELDSPVLEPGDRQVSFRVRGPHGEPVTEFEAAHGERLHFIAVRRDTTGFQHVHPTMDEQGTWHTELRLTPGDWRFYTDFRPAGHQAMT